MGTGSGELSAVPPGHVGQIEFVVLKFPDPRSAKAGRGCGVSDVSSRAPPAWKPQEELRGYPRIQPLTLARDRRSIHASWVRFPGPWDSGLPAERSSLLGAAGLAGPPGGPDSRPTEKGLCIPGTQDPRETVGPSLRSFLKVSAVIK